MSYSESYYIDKINKLQAEVDEDNELIEQCYNKIKQLELELQLANSSFTKKGLSEKKENKYKEQIQALEDTLGFFSEDVLETKADEIESLTKKIIAMRRDLNTLIKRKQIRDTEVELMDANLTSVSSDLTTRLTGLMQSVENLREIKSGSITPEQYSEYIQKLNTSLGLVKEIISFYKNESIKLNKENKRLKSDILRYTGSDTSYSDLVSQLELKDMEIEALKVKIDGLEFELSRQGKNSDDFEV